MASRNGRELDFCWPLFLAFCEATSVSILGIGSQLLLGGLVTFCGRPRLREYDNAIMLGVVVTLRLNDKNFIWQWENLAIEIERQSSMASHQLIKEVSFTAQAIALKRPIITDVLLMPWPASLFVHEVIATVYRDSGSVCVKSSRLVSVKFSSQTPVSQPPNLRLSVASQPRNSSRVLATTLT